MIKKVGDYVKSDFRQQFGAPSASRGSDLCLPNDFAHYPGGSLERKIRDKCHIYTMLWSNLVARVAVEAHQGQSVIVEIRLVQESKSTAAATPSPGFNVLKSIIQPQSDASDGYKNIIVQTSSPGAKKHLSRTTRGSEERLQRLLAAGASNYTGSEASLEVAGKWIQKCKMGHQGLSEDSAIGYGQNFPTHTTPQRQFRVPIRASTPNC